MCLCCCSSVTQTTQGTHLLLPWHLHWESRLPFQSKLVNARTQKANYTCKKLKIIIIMKDHGCWQILQQQKALTCKRKVPLEPGSPTLTDPVNLSNIISLWVSHTICTVAAQRLGSLGFEPLIFCSEVMVKPPYQTAWKWDAQLRWWLTFHQNEIFFNQWCLIEKLDWLFSTYSLMLEELGLSFGSGCLSNNYIIWGRAKRQLYIKQRKYF